MFPLERVTTDYNLKGKWGNCKFSKEQTRKLKTSKSNGI